MWCQDASSPEGGASPADVSLDAALRELRSVGRCGIVQGCKVKPLVMSGSNETNSNELSRDGSLASASQKEKRHPDLCSPSHAADFYS